MERYEQVRMIAAQIAASRSETPASRIDDLFEGELGYATPKLDIRALVLDEKGDVLLVKEKEDGRWTLPGGWVDVGESPSEAPAHALPRLQGLLSVRAIERRSSSREYGDRRGRLLRQRRTAGAFLKTGHASADQEAH